MDTWISALAKSLKHYLPWPHFFKCTPALRHKPLPQDDEVEFYNDLRYMEDLADAIKQECTLAKFEDPQAFCSDIARPLAAALSIPVESQKFWQEWDWPEDHAAALLSLWRFDNELRNWMDGTESAA